MNRTHFFVNIPNSDPEDSDPDGLFESGSENPGPGARDDDASSVGALDLYPEADEASIPFDAYAPGPIFPNRMMENDCHWGPGSHSLEFLYPCRRCYFATDDDRWQDRLMDSSTLSRSLFRSADGKRVRPCGDCQSEMVRVRWLLAEFGRVDPTLEDWVRLEFGPLPWVTVEYSSDNPPMPRVPPHLFANCINCGQAGRSDFRCSYCPPEGDRNRRVLWETNNSRIIHPVIISFMHGMEVCSDIGLAIRVDRSLAIPIHHGHSLALPWIGTGWDDVPFSHRALRWNTILRMILRMNGGEEYYPAPAEPVRLDYNDQPGWDFAEPVE
jgi:hypothetical protein